MSPVHRTSRCGQNGLPPCRDLDNVCLSNYSQNGTNPSLAASHFSQEKWWENKGGLLEGGEFRITRYMDMKIILNNIHSCPI